MSDRGQWFSTAGYALHIEQLRFKSCGALRVHSQPAYCPFDGFIAVELNRHGADAIATGERWLKPFGLLQATVVFTSGSTARFPEHTEP